MTKPKQTSLRKPRPLSKNTEDKMRRAVFLRSLGFSLRDIGSVLGISGEYVRVILNKAGMTPEETELAFWRRQESLLEEKALTWLDSLEHRFCIVCEQRITTQRINFYKVKTCSTECSEAWNYLRYHTTDGYERQRMSTAKWILSNPEISDEVQLRWAKRIINGTADARGSWYLKGSKTEEYAKQFGWFDTKLKNKQVRKEVKV